MPNIKLEEQVIKENNTTRGSRRFKITYPQKVKINISMYGHESMFTKSRMEIKLININTRETIFNYSTVDPDKITFNNVLKKGNYEIRWSGENQWCRTSFTISYKRRVYVSKKGEEEQETEIESGDDVIEENGKNDDIPDSQYDDRKEEEEIKIELIDRKKEEEKEKEKEFEIKDVFLIVIFIIILVFILGR